MLRFTPAQNILLQRIGLTEEEVDKAFQFNENYQSAMRSNIRVKDDETVPFVNAAGKPDRANGEGEVPVYVIDKPSAEDLISDFPNAPPISQLPPRLIPEAQPKQQSDARPDGYENWSESEKGKWRAKQYRARDRASRSRHAEARERMEAKKREGGASE